MHIPSRLEPLLAAGAPAVDLARRFGDAGYSLYLVGGSVRDALLGRDSDGIDDLDLTTDAEPNDVVRLVRPWAEAVFDVGAEYGTIGAMLRGTKYEITTFRSEAYRDESRKPRVTFSSSIEEDLSRRDFTVNAVALRIPASSTDAPAVVDPHGGLGDIAAKVLRTPLDPAISFGDDPLRMLRLFRFQATLGFIPESAALETAAALKDRLGIISAERIRDELDKLIVGNHVAVALWGLIDSGLAGEFLPELPALGLAKDPGHRHKDVLAHTIAVVEKTAPRLTLRLAALLHDIGKPATRSFADGGVSFHHHEVVGARMARQRLRALRYPRQRVEDVSQLVFLHMRPHTYKMGWTDSAVRRYVRDAGPLLADLNGLVRSDVTTKSARRANAVQRRIDELEERIAELREQEELDSLRPPIDGHAVMAYLDLAPGPVVGRIMDMLLEHRIEEGPYSEEEAFRMLDAWRDPGGEG